ncbi:hypothetical protein [Streptacidiphilus melanogenes]|uniref:hypothetical protein n=1 Tax=Streptacidiphilus melanogenes TaxID=411235 RepID=UPI0005A8B655|nr:hypothetical protein [Streptacidiphilus melanogenes]
MSQQASRASSPPTPAAGTAIGIKLLDAPENRRADPRAQAYIIDHLAPGQTIERRVEVTNEAPTPMHVDVYTAAATIGQGKFTFAPQHTPNELTGWTSFDKTTLELAASETTRVRTTIQIPKDATAGERYAVIWAQTPIAVDRDHSHNLTVLGRVGVRIYLDVGPGGDPPSDFKIERIYATRARDGRQEVHAQIQNTGHRALDIKGTLTLSDGPGKLRAGPFAATPGTTLAPGDHAEAIVPLDARLPDGPWTAELTLQSGLIEHTQRATITFPTPHTATTTAASVTGQGHLPILTTALLAALTLTISLLLPKLLHHHQRR